MEILQRLNFLSLFLVHVQDADWDDFQPCGLGRRQATMPRDHDYLALGITANQRRFQNPLF